jgi:hypothetical protein
MNETLRILHYRQYWVSGTRMAFAFRHLNLMEESGEQTSHMRCIPSRGRHATWPAGRTLVQSWKAPSGVALDLTPTGLKGRGDRSKNILCRVAGRDFMSKGMGTVGKHSPFRGYTTTRGLTGAEEGEDAKKIILQKQVLVKPCWGVWTVF